MNYLGRTALKPPDSPALHPRNQTPLRQYILLFLLHYLVFRLPPPGPTVYKILIPTNELEILKCLTRAVVQLAEYLSGR